MDVVFFGNQLAGTILHLESLSFDVKDAFKNPPDPCIYRWQDRIVDHEKVRYSVSLRMTSFISATRVIMMMNLMKSVEYSRLFSLPVPSARFGTGIEATPCSVSAPDMGPTVRPADQLVPAKFGST